MKQITKTFLSGLLLTAFGPAMAAGSGLSLSAGIEYSTGKYADQQSTDILYFPLIAKYETATWILKLTLPYVQITGPGNVVGGDDHVVHVSSMGAGIRRSASGQGDVVAAGTYNIYQNAGHSLLLDLTGKIKFATADASKGLGTGKNDFSLQTDMVKRSGAWMLFGSLGRRQMGDPTGIDFKNPWFGSLGAGYRPNDATQFGAVYDTRQRVIDAGARLSEIIAFAVYKLSSTHTLQGYIVKGFSDGSPDWGIGVVVTSHF